MKLHLVANKSLAKCYFNLGITFIYFANSYSKTNQCHEEAPRMPDTLEPIEYTCHWNAMPAQVYRALTSQNELRKWWARQVVISRNKVCQREGIEVEMKLIVRQRNRSVRYSWRPIDWKANTPETVITFSINDLGASRQKTGEGLKLNIVHDGWVDSIERESQEHIWKLALESLKILLETGKEMPWWEHTKKQEIHDTQKINLQELKQYLEKTYKRSETQNLQKWHHSIWKICSALSDYGSWYIKKEQDIITLHIQNEKFFTIHKGTLCLHWKELTGLAETYKHDFKSRLSVEQDINIDMEEEESNLNIDSLNSNIWIAWCIDLAKTILNAQPAIR